MRGAAAELEFEEAARLRDEIRRLEQIDLGLLPDGSSGNGSGGARGRSTMGRAGVSAREAVRAKVRARAKAHSRERRAR